MNLKLVHELCEPLCHSQWRVVFTVPLFRLTLMPLWTRNPNLPTMLCQVVVAQGIAIVGERLNNAP